ncbi:hypothetical protein [Nonomuraea sp. NPDC049480]|uniref:hypothetical protein n=1 Tax=Nonomuraea sp. NPDC049480 TaxID=3364353 RepID=UPI00379D9B9C
MRSAIELRTRWLETIPLVIVRAGMYARDGREMETVGRTLLENLCFIDEREDDFAAIDRMFADRYGKHGVHGPFAAMFGADRRCVEEVASVYAEHFHRLGYLQVAHELDEGRWAGLLGTVRNRFEGQDVRRSEVQAAFGPPGLVVGKRILCYVSTTGDWAFFDCWDEPTRRYVAGAGTYESLAEVDPLVCSIRIPAADFESGLVLTLYGKVLRWGPAGGSITRARTPRRSPWRPPRNCGGSREMILRSGWIDADRGEIPRIAALGTWRQQRQRGSAARGTSPTGNQESDRYTEVACLMAVPMRPLDSMDEAAAAGCARSDHVARSPPSTLSSSWPVTWPWMAACWTAIGPSRWRSSMITCHRGHCPTLDAVRSGVT